MTDSQGNLPPAGWYPDPYGAPYERWWDGAQWTDHTNTPAPPAPAAPVQEPAVQTPAVQTPAVQSPAVQEQPVQQPAVQQQPVQQPAEAAPAVQQSAWNTGAAAASSSFDDIFATGQPSQQEAQEQYTAPQQAYTAPQQYSAPEQYTAPQYGVPAAGDPASDFRALITGGGAGGDSDSFDSWSSQTYEEPPRNTMATVGLTFGVLSFVLVGIGGLIGLVTSVLGLLRANRFKREEGQAIGQGKSLAGIILSLVGSAVAAFLVLTVLPMVLNTTAAPSDAVESEVVVNGPKTDFGNIGLAVGEKGTVVVAGTQDPAIQFSVTNIALSPECNGDPELVLSPENGEFVAVTMEFTTSAEYTSSLSSGQLLQVAMRDFVGLLPDGTTVVNTDAGMSCVPEDELLPTEIPAGTTTTGLVILDVSPTTTSFSYSPTGVTGLDPSAVRWEWAIPR